MSIINTVTGRSITIDGATYNRLINDGYHKRGNKLYPPKKSTKKATAPKKGPAAKQSAKKQSPVKQPAPMNNSCVIANFKYAVLATGYTERLFDRIDELNIELAKLFSEDEESRLVYIDSMHGETEVYKQVDDLDRIKAIKADQVRAYVAFECSTLHEMYDIVDVLERMQYCYGVGVTGIYKYQLIDGDILVVSFDTESG